MLCVKDGKVTTMRLARGAANSMKPSIANSTTAKYEVALEKA